MRFLSVFRKSMKEQLRDITVLGLTLVFAPLFVYLYWVFFPSGSTTFNVLVLNHDKGAQLPTGEAFWAGEQVVEALHEVGIEVSERFVSQVKAQMLRDEAKATRERSKRPPKTKSRSRPQQQKIPPRRG